MKLFCEAQFFNESIDFSSKFEIQQKELLFKDLKNKKQNKVSFYPILVNYTCDFVKSENFKEQNPTIIIPIKDSSDLLSYTLKNLEDNEIINYCNVLVVDDRSSQNIKEIVLSKNHSYLRVDNKKGFNFSMLNNIAAKICYDLGNKTIILWNSDLWAKNKTDLPNLLENHKKEKSKLSGSKLVYPPIEISLNNEADSPNIKNYFPNLLGGKWRKTVQFGGESWFINFNAPVIYSPVHYKRFCRIEDPLVNCNRGALFVTGALHIYDLEFFIKIGGLNPSLSKVFQDVDICLRAYESGNCPMYFGKDIYFYHDESLSTSGKTGKDKEDVQFVSDHYLFGKLWNNKVGKFLGHGVN